MKVSEPAFQHFLEYIEMVCDMINFSDIHDLGDEVFLESLAQKCIGYRSVANKDVISLRGTWNL